MFNNAPDHSFNVLNSTSDNTNTITYPIQYTLHSLNKRSITIMWWYLECWYNAAGQCCPTASTLLWITNNTWMISATKSLNKEPIESETVAVHLAGDCWYLERDFNNVKCNFKIVWDDMCSNSLKRPVTSSSHVHCEPCALVCVSYQNLLRRKSGPFISSFIATVNVCFNQDQDNFWTWPPEQWQLIKHKWSPKFIKDYAATLCCLR